MISSEAFMDIIALKRAGHSIRLDLGATPEAWLRRQLSDAHRLRKAGVTH